MKAKKSQKMKVIPGLITLILSLMISSETWSQGSWETGSSLPTPRSAMGVAALNGKIYVVGGFIYRDVPTWLVNAYDVNSDSWEQVASLAVALHSMGVVAHNGKLYCVGGENTSGEMLKSVYEYDPNTDKWTQKSDLIRPKCVFAMSKIKDKIYIMSGQDNWRSPSPLCFSYDIIKYTCSSIADIPTARWYSASASIDSFIYVIGGRLGPICYNTNEVYSIENNKWLSLHAMPTSRTGLTAEAYNGKIYVIGGNNNNSVFAINEEYDPSTGFWKEMAPLPTPRRHMGSAIVDGKIYVIGGDTTTRFSATDIVEVYTPPTKDSIPITPLAPKKTYPGEEFWVDIEVGSSSKPVTDLKIVSFEFQYTNTSIVDYVSYEIGTFLTGAQATIIPDDPNGKISASIYRISGGNSGHGVVLRLMFKVLNSASEGDSVCFIFADVQANNSSGGEIPLSPLTSSTEIVVGTIPVWPGDANNDGQVSIFDINSIVAIHWNKTGPLRPNASNRWVAQYCQTWNPVEATYADCNGSGKVDIFDINSVIVNFDSTHTLSQALLSFKENELDRSPANPPIFLEELDYDDITHDFWLDIKVGTTSQPVNDLKVVSFELTYSNTENVAYVAYEAGNFPSQAQATVIVDDKNGKISASIYRTSGGDSGSGVVLSLKLNAERFHTVIFNFEGVIANSSDGSTILLSPTGDTIHTSVAEFSNIKPDKFALFPNYPNPFNPTTCIEYGLPEDVHVTLKIFNILGKEVVTLVEQKQPAGFYRVKWDGKDNTGSSVNNGIYIYQLTAGDFVATRKMTLLK